MNSISAFFFILFLARSVAGSTLHAANDPYTSGPGGESFSENRRLWEETHGKLDERHLAALRKAASEGHQLAESILGVYLVTERGKTDFGAMKEGVSWLKRIENMDSPDFDGANFLLGLCYLNGMGTIKNIDRAGVLLARTSARGNSDMKMAYATFLDEIKKDTAGAKRLFMEIAEDPSSPTTQQQAKEVLRSLR